MRKHLSNEELPTKLFKKHFHRTIWTPREKYLKHKNGNFDIELTKIWEFKINHFDLKQSLEPRIHRIYTGGKSEWLKIRKWETQN